MKKPFIQQIAQTETNKDAGGQIQANRGEFPHQAHNLPACAGWGGHYPATKPPNHLVLLRIGIGSGVKNRLLGIMRLRESQMLSQTSANFLNEHSVFSKARAKSASVWAAEIKEASNCDGAR